MLGYTLIEQKYMKPFLADGVKPCVNRFGFLDFLREIETNGTDLPLDSDYFVSGLEQTLYAISEAQREEMAHFFGKKLRHAAQSLQRKRIQVQIVFSGTLRYGNTLYLEYRRERLPIDHIFGKPMRNPLQGGACCYNASFNLTS